MFSDKSKRITDNRLAGSRNAVLIVVILGFVLSISLYRFLATNFRTSVQARFDSAVQQRAKTLEYGVKPYLDALYYLVPTLCVGILLGRSCVP